VTRPALQAQIDPTRLRYYRTTLRRWFDAQGRDLPWRRTRDPYRIMVSEIMLHQTQVPRVASVYNEFIDRFPSLQDVADASLDEVKAITDPLGYKRRGGYIKQIADEVVEYRAGEFPRSVEGLMELPGIGRYTAGAIMTFAHEEPAPILDTNVARVLGRWFAGALPPDEGETPRRHRLWALAGALVPQTANARHSGWTINQALMDLGAQLCSARSPSCDDCPLRRRCHHAQPDRAQRESEIVIFESAPE
jgi:A/G-specific adenine glycosylase